MGAGQRDLRARGTPQPRARHLAAIAAALLCASSAAALDDPEALATTAAAAEVVPHIAPEQPFDDHFEPFSGPRPDLQVPDHAVDLAAIDTPVEQQATGSLGSGTASFYGRQFHGRRTASGEAFDMHEMTAAHRTLPFGSKVRVTNPANGKSVVVRINDRGPFSRGRLIDVSRAAAEELGIVARGHARVDLDLVE